MSDIFISYSHIDREYVVELVEKLRYHGFNVWYDNDLTRGTRWAKQIESVIESCQALIVIMTPEANDSEWVEREILHAQNENKPIFPILLRGKPFFMLNNKQHVELPLSALVDNNMTFIKFIKDLQKAVPRTPQSRQRDYPIPPKPQPFISNTKDISEWIHFQQGVNDFYGITMLALAYEANGQHKNAIYHLRRGHKLEPRIRDKAWMTKHYMWTDEQHSLLEKIILDDDFWQDNLWKDAK